jgi:hypothetical protein
VTISSAIAVGSAVAFSAGCYYIKVVWFSEEDIGYSSEELTSSAFFGWLLLCAMLHAIHYRLTRRKLSEAMDATGTVSESGSAGPEEAKRGWRYQSQIFQPPDNIGFAAKELTKATAHAAVATVRGSLSIWPAAESICGRTVRTMSVDSNASNRRRANSGTSSASDEGGEMNNAEEKGLVRSSRTSATEELMQATADQDSEAATRQTDSEGVRDDGAEQVEAEKNQPTQDLTPRSVDDTSVRDVDCNDALLVDGGSVKTDEEQPIADHPSVWFMMKSNTCCGRRKHYHVPPKKPLNRCFDLLKWTLWGVTTGLHLYLTIINIGATVQQNIVRAALPATHETFYPPDYVTGTMCAWNESSPNADIRTFDSLADVNAANYSVVHCGACGNCSNWNDLSLQWTTRTHLAEVAQDW